MHEPHRMDRAALLPDHHTHHPDTDAWCRDYPLPMPNTPDLARCPICSGPVVVKDWRFHTRQGTGSTSPWRCDVRTKCTRCALVLIYGVRVPHTMLAAAAKTGGGGVNTWIGWRTGRTILEDAGYFAGMSQPGRP